MTETNEDHIPDTEGPAADILRSALERYEDLARERADLAEFQKEIIAELKAQGFDTVAFRKLVSLRKKVARDLEEQAQILQLYMDALGIEIKGVIA